MALSKLFLAPHPPQIMRELSFKWNLHDHYFCMVKPYLMSAISYITALPLGKKTLVVCG